MKTLVISITLCLISTGAFCQQKTTKTLATPKKAPATAATQYKCPVCGYIASAKGDCPKDKTSMVKVGDYYCPDCYMTSSKPGKCDMCGVDMKLMETAKK